MAIEISIKKLGNTTQLRVANTVTNKVELINCNSSREIRMLDAETVIIVSDPNEKTLNNFKINVNNLSNDGNIDFTGIDTAVKLLDLIGEQELFKNGGGWVIGGEKIYNISYVTVNDAGKRFQGFLTPNIWIDGYYLSGNINDESSYSILEKKTIARIQFVQGSRQILSTGNTYFTDLKPTDKISTIYGIFTIETIVSDNEVTIDEDSPITDNSILFKIKEV